jgi:choice-of-anchor B domain-containing protein
MAIAIDGNRIVVGAPGRNNNKGAVFIFERDSTGNWTQQSERAAPPNLPDGSQLGLAVAVKGDVVVAGAPTTNFTPQVLPNPVRDSLLLALSTAQGDAREAIITRLNQMTTGRGGRGGVGGGGGGGGGRGATIGLATGMVFTYARASFGSWRTTTSLAPFDFGNVQFGAAVHLVGDELWIGAPGAEGAGRIYRARADRDGGFTGGMTKLGVDSVESGAQWAAAFAVSGDAAIIGMPGDGGGGGTVAFMNRAPATGTWSLRSMHIPEITERYTQVMGKEAKCENGKVGPFDCNSTSLLSYMPLSAIGARRGVRLSGSWGWTDPVTGKDIAILGRTDGTAFVDVTDPVNPKYLGDLLRTKGSNASSWREVKTFKQYALIVSDGSGDRHGVQIFDLTRLRGVTTPRRFTEDAHFDAGSIHNIAVNEQSGYAYAVGTSSGGERCAGGSLIINMKQPLKPTFEGCFADSTGNSDSYTHDIQCVMYKGPDKRYTGREICMAANEQTVSIQDVTDKKNIKIIAQADYPTPGYTHQGWFTEDQRYWYLNDELDEGRSLGRSAEGTRTMIFDLADLQQPVMIKEHIGPTRATDHNLYVKGDRMYQSNYLAGLRILDISDPRNPKEIGHLDTTPGENTSSMSGSWNNYPFFRNGAIGVVSMGEGFFMVKDVPKRIAQ